MPITSSNILRWICVAGAEPNPIFNPISGRLPQARRGQQLPTSSLLFGNLPAWDVCYGKLNVAPVLFTTNWMPSAKPVLHQPAYFHFPRTVGRQHSSHADTPVPCTVLYFAGFAFIVAILYLLVRPSSLWWLYFGFCFGLNICAEGNMIITDK